MCLRSYKVQAWRPSAESQTCSSSRYPRYRGFPGPDFSTGNGRVPPEGGIQHQHDDHKFVQDNANGGAASLQRYATQGSTVHEPGYCQGLHHRGKRTGVLVTSPPFFSFPSIFISAEEDSSGSFFGCSTLMIWSWSGAIGLSVGYEFLNWRARMRLNPVCRVLISV